ncbi:Integrase [Desulfovibrio sp. G11]|nr:Integrase [Desulfovibrio sp. G11]
MIQRMRDNPAATVAAGFGVSLRTARKWMKRYREGGLASLADASSRPRHCRNRLTELDVSRIFELRKKRQTGDAIALRLGLCRSTVFRALRRLGCSRLSSLEEKEPVQRYQWAKPGQMLHLDIKRLGKIDGVGHRKTGTRQVRRRRPGWEYLHVCVDDASRAAYTAVLPDETAESAIESLNMSLRKVTKAKGAFPHDEAVFKIFWLALRNISKKWTMPIRDWKAALNRFAIQFEERFPT